MPHLETLLAQAGCGPDPGTGALVVPIHLSTTFERAPDGAYPHGYLYCRNDNPTRHQFEATLAMLEGGAACAAFALGMAAINAVFQVRCYFITIIFFACWCVGVVNTIK